MKFLANENFPGTSIKILREAGFDVKSVKEDRPSIADRDVVKWANEEVRTILTFDKDYGEIVIRYRVYCSVVFFRKKGNSPDYAAKELLSLMKKIKIEGYFTVLDHSGVRQRELNF